MPVKLQLGRVWDCCLKVIGSTNWKEISVMILKRKALVRGYFCSLCELHYHVSSSWRKASWPQYHPDFFSHLVSVCLRHPETETKIKNLSWIYTELISKKQGIPVLQLWCGNWGYFTSEYWESQTAVTKGLTRKMLQSIALNLGQIHYREKKQKWRAKQGNETASLKTKSRWDLHQQGNHSLV